ncbi:chromate efflux transporter [Dyadobacter psychrotolerans]|uniref:Chromate efflux transporter n=1 Tax=Dyadobacter psychrotolerans TaxID=2541721 RepID=A0A4R5DL50_9BACT|nr:chromate efflux transporter [Dyadobacter psychrotolerans]TDE12760.1 chromate efflux transporter [Dyadobacter psychrotolerans]
MKVTLTYLFFTFLRIGATSWGGFMGVISMIQKRVAEKDGKIENETIMEGISLASVLPGPMAVNVVSFVGYKLGGIKGAFVSIIAVLFPSFVLMLVLSHLYFKYGDIPAMNHFFSGVLPAVAAVILSVAVSMGEKNIKDWPQGIIAIAAAAIVAFSKSYLTTLIVLIVSGLIGYFYYNQKKTAKTVKVKKKDKKEVVVIEQAGKGITYSIILITAVGAFVFFYNGQNVLLNLHRQIFLTFSSMSLTQFGGGYVIIPTMQKIIVNGMKWLTNKEFVDAIAMGQITPGPIFVSATFIGYKLSGFWGALNATISIFLPTAILTIVCTRFFNQISKSTALIAVFKGLRPAIIGMIVSAAYTIMANNGFTIFTVIIFVIAQLLVMRFKVDPVYLIPAAGVAGLLIL